MVIFLTALLVSSKLQIDREALELQARAEALQPRHHIAQPARRPSTPVVATRQPLPQPVRQAPPPVRQAAAQPIRQPMVRRASAGTPLDLAQITTICRAAGEQDDPGAFIGRLSSAYSLSADDRTSLRSSCAAYLAGRADARRNNY
jgi:hypothetical protein